MLKTVKKLHDFKLCKGQAEWFWREQEYEMSKWTNFLIICCQCYMEKKKQNEVKRKNKFLIIDFQGGSHVAVWACSSFLFSVVKVHRPIFKNLGFFLFPLKNHHSKDVNFKFQWKWSSHLDVRSNFLLQLLISYYVSLIMVTITICSHVFVNIYQMEHWKY